MSDTKTQKGNSNMNAVIAGATGAVIGAGVGIAAASAMKDEKTKEKVQQLISTAKDQALEYVDSVANQDDTNQGKKGGKSSKPEKRVEATIATTKNS